MYQVIRTLVYTYDTADQALKDQMRWAVPPNGYGPGGAKRTICSSVTPLQDIGGGWPDEYTRRHFDAFGQMSGEQQVAHLTEHHDEPVPRGLLRRSDVIDHHIEQHRSQQRAEQETERRCRHCGQPIWRPSTTVGWYHQLNTHQWCDVDTPPSQGGTTAEPAEVSTR